MIVPVALALQAAAGPVLPDPRGCPAALPGEVQVCARRRDESPYRVKPLGPAPAIDPPRDLLGFGLPGGGSGKVEAIQTNLPGGFTGQGAAVRLKWPLGKRKQE